MDPRILRLLFHAVSLAEEGQHSLVLVGNNDLASELWDDFKPENASLKRQNHHLRWVWEKGGRVTFAKGAVDNNVTLEQQVKYGIPGVQADNVFVDPALLEIAFADVIHRLHRWDDESLHQLEQTEADDAEPEAEQPADPTDDIPPGQDGTIVEEGAALAQGQVAGEGTESEAAEEGGDPEQRDGGAPSEPTS